MVGAPAGSIFEWEAFVWAIEGAAAIEEPGTGGGYHTFT